MIRKRSHLEIREGSVSVDRSVQSKRLVGAGRPPTGPVASTVFVIGALLIFTSAAIHLHLWGSSFRYTRTIGPLFFVQGALGILVGILVALIRRIYVASLGVLFACGTIAALLVAVHRGLFGYHTYLGAPWARTSLIIEAAAAAVLLVGSIIATYSERKHTARWRSETRY
ncbi:MAG: hypothetical protein ABR925_06370 [Acidimicrobiales bacterium]